VSPEIELPNTTVANSTHDDVRLILYVDVQANGAQAAVLDILKTANYQSFYNRSNKDRFVILMDRVHTLFSSAGMVNGYGDVSQNVEFEVDLELNIQFSGASGEVTEITSNNIGVLAISGSGLAELNSQMRILYVDN